jgi:hypothetical protein
MFQYRVPPCVACRVRYVGPRMVRAHVPALVAFLLVAVPARAAAPRGNFELGVRSGYSLAAGNASAPEPLDKLASGNVPIWIDAGYRTPYLYAGVFFQLGIVVIPGSACSTDCSGTDVQGGVDVLVHPFPGGKVDPWIGVGGGYEWLDFTVTNDSSTGASAQPQSSASLRGWELLSAQLGVDFRDDVVMPGLGIGPFVMVNLGQYTDASASGPPSVAFTIPQQAIHAWITLGVRGAFDIGFRAPAEPPEPTPVSPVP